MSDSTSTPPPPVYNFYFADQLNVSQERKDSRSSSVSAKSDQLKSAVKSEKNDAVLQETKIETKNAEESLLEGIEQNQFITEYGQNGKNAKTVAFKAETQFFSQFELQQEYLSGHIQKQEQPEQETSFLLDSDTYKEICIEEHSKRVEFCSNFDVKSIVSIEDVCALHQKPFEIVCVEDKTLVCSHCAIFGEHKAHSLAPLKQIEKSIETKKSQVNQIISDYKALQLSIKQKSFASQFVEKIHLRKNQLKLTVEQQFRKIKEFLSTYERQIETELDNFYHALENKLVDCIKRTSLESNIAAFERWQKDASTIIQQISFDDMPKKSRVNLFLNNFTIPEFPQKSNKFQDAFNPVSLQIEGQKYFAQIKEELNLNIHSIIQTVESFNFTLDDTFEPKIKSLVNFECDSKINDVLDENKLTLIEERYVNFKCFDSIKESMKRVQQKTSQSIHVKTQENEMASTVVSIGQGTPINTNHMLKGNSKFNSPLKKHDSQKQQTQKVEPPETLRKSLKYKRYETLQDMKKLQQNMRTTKSPSNILDAKSEYGQKKRRISPCLKDIIPPQNEKLFASSTNSRIVRYKSKDFTTHKRSPSGECKKQGKNPKHDQQTISESPQQPLKALQNYEKNDTETLDLSNCNLNDTQILYFVQKASKIRKIKHLKLSSNLLTSSGFEKLIPYISNCNLINLSSNSISETIVEMVLKKKDKLGHLRMLNLSNNKLNERRIKERMGEFKKMNLVVTL